MPTESMHRPTGRPACYSVIGMPLTERAPWSFDRAASCGNGHNLADANLSITPGCRGCARLERSIAIAAGTIDPLPSSPKAQ